MPFASLRTLARPRLLLAALGLILAPMAPRAADSDAAPDAPSPEKLEARVQKLEPAMSRSERVQLARFQRAIRSAQSDIRSARSMMERDATALTSEKEANATRERGKARLKSARKRLRQQRLALAKFLDGIAERRTQEMERLRERASFEIPAAADLASARRHVARRILEKQWTEGAERIFFGGVYASDASGVFRRVADASDAVYQTLAELDGDRFTVREARSPSLAFDREQGEPFVDFENRDPELDETAVLLVGERIASSSAPEGLLVLRAVGMGDFRIRDSAVARFPASDAAASAGERAPSQTENGAGDAGQGTDTGAGAKSEPDTSGASGSAGGEAETEGGGRAEPNAGPSSAETRPLVPKALVIRDESLVLKRLESLSDRYSFEIDFGGDGAFTPPRREALRSMLKHALARHTSVPLSEFAFLRSALSASGAADLAQNNPANARFILLSADEGDTKTAAGEGDAPERSDHGDATKSEAPVARFRLQAQSRGKTVEIGEMVLRY